MLKQGGEDDPLHFSAAEFRYASAKRVEVKKVDSETTLSYALAQETS